MTRSAADIAGASMRVLVVEDQRQLREMLGANVAEFGFQVHAVASAESARELLSREAFDILLCDHHLPGMTGAELLTQVHRSGARPQAVLMTAYATLELAQQAIRLDAVDFLRKPFQLSELEQALARAVSRVRQSRLYSLETATPHEPLNASSKSLASIEREHIARTLQALHGNMTAAARVLGVSRRAMYNKVKRFGLT